MKMKDVPWILILSMQQRSWLSSQWQKCLLYNSSQSSKWAVAVLTPTEANVSGFKADFSWPAKVGGSHVSTNYQEIEITNTASWVTYTVEGLVITPAARIAFGAYDGAGSSVCRACISDIKLEITEIK